MITTNSWLVAAACLSGAVALFHAIGAFSPSLCRYFGAPERLIAAGRAVLACACFGIAGIFAACGVYALAGAGCLPQLPLLLPVLIVTTALYTLRGVLVAVQLLVALKFVSLKVPTELRMIFASAISLGIGLTFLMGTLTYWRQLVRQ
jgi:hypothetical protein